MLKKFKAAMRKDRYLQTAFVVFLIGAFLRFYRLGAFVTFLGDQGRDAIVIKRLITGEHFPAIGPASSVGNIYLGSFYYYFIAPWLLLFRFDPIGLAVGVAFISSLFILIQYFLVERIFDKTTALLSCIFVAFSSTLIEFSRFSWNPNLLPVFAFLTIYLFIEAFEKKRPIYFFLAGVALSSSIQLHYLALVLIPGFVFVLAKKILQKKVRTPKNFLNIVICTVGFVLFASPLIIFDLRHQFINSRNFLILFHSTGSMTTSLIPNFMNTAHSFGMYAFSLKTSGFLAVPFIISLIFALVLMVKGKGKVSNFFIFYFFATLGIGLYGGPKYPHYFAVLYVLFFITISYLFTKLPKNIWGYGLTGLFAASFILVNSQNYTAFFQNGSYQIDKAKKISKFIFDNVREKDYMVTAIPEVYSDHTARYFLEIWGKKPLERDNTKNARELFVICENPCKPIGNPLYDIAVFSAKKITASSKVDNVTIYKLTH